MPVPRTCALVLVCASTLLPQSRIFTQQDLDRVTATAQSQPWAADALSSILRSAQAFPNDHTTRYALPELALPPEGGQWPHYYVCPTHGVNLAYRAPNTHTCPIDNRTYSGWPYDQVIFMRRHSDLAAAARDSALAFRLTGESKYAENAAWILNQYARQYLNYTLKDVNNRNTRTAGRASAQTLDEAVWLIPLAWAYDLLQPTSALSAADRAAIEKSLFRAAVEVIQRNDAGISNWQSWHNAAIAAAGFALNDDTLIHEAIRGKSGFEFQMANSVIGEGFWYEGAWSYHYYALDPITQLAEMAERNGFPLWENPSLKGLFSAPLRLAFADGTLPAFNDSNAISIYSQARLYETAFRRIPDPLFAAVAARSTRARDALLFGSPEIPAATLAHLTSEVFEDSGFAVLRAPHNDHTVTMKFGPHGGGHGHYDKLGLVSFARNGILAVDPGTQLYAAPTHNTWDKLTVAHNTVVINQTTQAEATGKLLWSDLTPNYSAASATAGPAYPGVDLERTLFVTDEYALDWFHVAAADGRPRQIDWVYHNNGVPSTSLPLTAYSALPKTNGYQHLTNNRAAPTSTDWSLTFDGAPVNPVNYGSVFASTSSVRGTFHISREQSANGRAAGKLSYNFQGPGYLLYSTPLLTNQSEQTPAGLKLMIYGDGSNHRLSIRINDATDERFVAAIGPVNWTGWKSIQVTAPATWTHYLGNNDGIVDAPIRNVSIEWNQVPNAPPSGVIFIDDFEVLYPGDAILAADFELPARNLRLSMLAGPDTTVVTGDGLGPDLLTPVPYVMARRTAATTDFFTLLEPFLEEPTALTFTRDPSGAFTVSAPQFEDHFQLTATGVSRYERVILKKLP